MAAGRAPHGTPRQTASPAPPIELRGEPHQWMAPIDDLLQPRPEHLGLTIFARLARHTLPPAKRSSEGITNWPKLESQNATKPRPCCKIGYLPRIDCPENQSLPNFSRTTDEVVDGDERIAAHHDPVFRSVAVLLYDSLLPRFTMIRLTKYDHLYHGLLAVPKGRCQRMSRQL